MSVIFDFRTDNGLISNNKVRFTDEESVVKFNFARRAVRLHDYCQRKCPRDWKFSVPRLSSLTTKIIRVFHKSGHSKFCSLNILDNTEPIKLKF